MSEPLPFRLRWIIALRESELTPMAKLCGFVVVSYMNDEGAAWPTLPTIAAGGSISRRAAVTAVNQLEAATFLQKESNRKGNRYYPQLLPETERLVDEFLDRARRRRGQLSIPLDARGLSVVDSAAGALRSAAGALHGAAGALRSAGDAPEVDSEVVSEVENEVGADQSGLSDESPLPELGAAVAAKLGPGAVPGSVESLLEALPDRDRNTEQVLRRYLSELPPHAAQHAREELLAAENVRRPTAYVVGILKNWVEKCASGVADPATATANFREFGVEECMACGRCVPLVVVSGGRVLCADGYGCAVDEEAAVPW